MKFNFHDDKEKLRAKQYLEKLSQKPSTHLVEITDKKKKRTIDQNEWLWSCIYPMLHYGLIQAGWEFTTVEQVHEFFKKLYAREKVINRETEEIIELPRSTSAMTTMEFSTYCDCLRDYAQEYLSITIPEPDPDWKNMNLP